MRQGQRSGERRRIAVLACGGIYESAALKIKTNNGANSGRGKGSPLVTGREAGLEEGGAFRCRCPRRPPGGAAGALCPRRPRTALGAAGASPGPEDGSSAGC